MVSKYVFSIKFTFRRIDMWTIELLQSKRDRFDGRVSY